MTALARLWFPLALIVLLLLALPGLVLFALHLLGLAAPVNQWLQDRFSLSYHIPVPSWAGAVLLLVPLLLILLYFLKLKRRPLHVPSTFLWRKSIEDLHVNTLFQWLRENVLLLLQLLTVLVLVYALMGFQVHGRSVEGKHYILMIDNSASMNATDVAPNRLHQAKQEALQEIDSHTDNDSGMVIVFNSSAEIRQSYTQDRSLLRSAVENIQPTHRPTCLEEALSLADSLANPTVSTENAASRPEGEDPSKAWTYVLPEGQATEVFLYSDGRFPDVPNFNLGNLTVHYHPQGQLGADAVDNVALTTLNAVRDDRDPRRLQVLARVQNFRSQEARVQIELEVRVNGELRGIYEEPADHPLILPARSQPSAEEGKEGRAERTPQETGYVIFQVSDIDDRSTAVLHARLKGVKDSFALDDEAWLVVGVVRKARVLIVGSENRLLGAFFNNPATQKVATVSYLPKEALSDRARYLQPAREGAWDLVVFDRCAPAKEDELPAANTWFIDAVPPPWKKADLPPLKSPLVKGWESKNTLMTYLRGLHEIGIADAFRFDLKDPRAPAHIPRLLESDRDTVLLFTLSRQSYTDLVQTFALIDDEGRFNCTWPLHPSFPLFLRNVIYVLGNVSDAVSEEAVQPGMVKLLRPDVPLKEIEVINPEGKAETIQRGLRPNFAYGKTERVGVYKVRWEGKDQRSFSVNLLDTDESDIEPRPEFKIGEETVQMGQARSQPRDTWKWIALGALGLLLLEWYIYNRRVFI